MVDTLVNYPASQPFQLTKQLIIFRVSKEEFGVPIEAVQEIIKFENTTPIPDAPSFIKGLINVRGEIVTVIDVRDRFSLPCLTQGISKHIVITKQRENLYGLMVDEVIEVLRIQDTDIKPPPAIMTNVQQEYVNGIVTYDERLIILLNLGEVLSEKEMIKLFNMTHHHSNNHGKESTKKSKNKS